MQISELPVHHKIIDKLSQQGFVELTDIQQASIFPTLQGKDVLACSQTGSGKTLAFLIPCLHRLITAKALSRKDPRALILAPTRELAKQVFLEAKKLCAGSNIRPTLIIGGDNYNDQCKALAREPALIIGTAGRIADHLGNRSFFLNGLELLILDEADRMLDLGFAEALMQIHQHADHRKRQTLLYSATLDNPAITQLASKLVSAPTRINIGLSTDKHDNIHQAFYFADNVTHKDELLTHLLNKEEYNQAIVFVATREDTNRLSALLNEALNINHVAIGLRGDLPQNQRAAVMNAFAKGQHGVLVTTDVASRGLDLPKVGMVINFDLPKNADEYIHRIGRTGRAGSSGAAISLVGKRDWSNFQVLSNHLDYAISASPHPELPAKFAGLREKAKSKQTKPNKSAKTTQQTPLTTTVNKRVNTMQGIDVGDAPIKKKAPKNND